MTASILGPSGTPLVQLGGDRAWKQRVLHGFVCSFQWIDIGEKEPSACMVIYRESRTMQPPAYVIPQANAWLYATAKGNPTDDTMGVAFKTQMALGMEPTRATTNILMDLIVEAIPDLIEMPSEQPESLDVARLVHGIEATAKMNGRLVHSELI